MKKNLFSIGLAFSMILGVAFSFGFAPQDKLMMAPEGPGGGGGGSSCANRPDENNGDCTYATSESGANTYFCENSWAFHDCVK